MGPSRETTIFYFDGTGNCLKVARDLAGELGGQTQIISMPRVINQEVSSEHVGFVYPVYMFGMPLLVARFIRQLNIDKNKYLFAIVTSGGSAGAALVQNAKLLKARGLKLSSGFILRMPANYAPFYAAPGIKKQQTLFLRQEKRIKAIARIIKEAREKKLEKGLILTSWIFSLIYRLALRHTPFLDKGFWVDEKCNGCSLCEKVCPVNNIQLINKKPSWLHKCEQCLTCLQWCPQEAIQYKKSTVGSKRYQNPYVKIQDLM